MNESTLLKSGRIGEIARVNRLPMINMLESAGADLTQQGKVRILCRASIHVVVGVHTGVVFLRSCAYACSLIRALLFLTTGISPRRWRLPRSSTVNESLRIS